MFLLKEQKLGQPFVPRSKVIDAVAWIFFFVLQSGLAKSCTISMTTLYLRGDLTFIWIFSCWDRTLAASDASQLSIPDSRALKPEKLNISRAD